MIMRRIVITEKLSSEQHQQIEGILPQWEILSGEQTRSDFKLLRSAEIITGFVDSELVEAILADTNDLQWLHVWSAGVDSMPFARLADRQIALTNSSGVHEHSITEVILMFLLALSRRLQCSLRSQLRHEWDMVKPLSGLHGRTLGILGVGTIGRRTAAAAQSLGMRVIGLSRSGAECEHVETMYRTEQLHELLPQCDYVVNILPLTAETRHIITEPEFALMRDGAVYVNVGRGGTTDTLALVEALISGKVAAAGLDVFETEPLPMSSPLWDMDQVIITAHNAGMTHDYVPRVMDILSENIKNYLVTGKPGRNLVDLDREY